MTSFFDFGTAWNRNNGIVIPRESLYSVGLGLRLEVGERFNARIDYDIPLAELDVEKDSLQENGIYFAIEFKPY
ncbi:MAG: hypothetical protein AB4372_19510 [Xenococcus sp. (in: cyanobacteria)]